MEVVQSPDAHFILVVTPAVMHCQALQAHPLLQIPDFRRAYFENKRDGKNDRPGRTMGWTAEDFQRVIYSECSVEAGASRTATMGFQHARLG